MGEPAYLDASPARIETTPRGDRETVPEGTAAAERRLRGQLSAACPLHQDDQTTGLRGEDDKVRRPCDACGKESTVWGPGIQRCPDHSMTLGLQLSTGKRLEDGKLVVECSAGCDPGALRAEVKRRARAEGIELPEPSTDKGDLDRYKAVDKHGWELVEMILRLPDIRGRLLEAIPVFEIIARVKTKAKAREDRVRRGRPEENAARLAVEQLCWIYEIVTGRPPGRDFDHHKKRGPSPFEKFAAAAIGRLWRNKAAVGGIFVPHSVGTKIAVPTPNIVPVSGAPAPIK